MEADTAVKGIEKKKKKEKQVTDDEYKRIRINIEEEETTYKWKMEKKGGENQSVVNKRVGRRKRKRRK